MSSNSLVILGMHRSGTSAAAGTLHNLGISMGDNLLAANDNNQKGHYEDLSLIELHQQIAKYNKIHDWKIINSVDYIYTSEFHKMASSFVQNNSAVKNQWGCKDPRMCLYLDFWYPYLQDSKYLILFRNYNSVANSIVSREIRNFLAKANFKMSEYWVNKLSNIFYKRKLFYIKVWILYNKNIINFLNKYQPKFYLSEFKDSIEKESFFDWLDYAGFQIDRKVNRDNFFNKSLIRENLYKTVNADAEKVLDSLYALKKIQK